MHQQIMKVGKGVNIDHRDGDGLDNRKLNLRVATNAQNSRNSRKRTGNVSSKYKGVSWHKRDKVWQVYIRYEGRLICIGSHKSDVVDGVDVGEIKAGKDYDGAAIKYFGAFARLNFPEERNIVKLKDGAYKMSYIMNEQDKKRIEKRITDIQSSVGSMDMINEILKVRDLQEIIDMCHYLECGVGELVARIKKYTGKVSDVQLPIIGTGQ
jgi:hypothetical protein